MGPYTRTGALPAPEPPNLGVFIQSFLQLSPGVLLEELIASELPKLSAALQAEEGRRGWWLEPVWLEEGIGLVFGFRTTRPVPPAVFIPTFECPDLFADVARMVRIQVTLRNMEEPLPLGLAQIDLEEICVVKLLLIPKVPPHDQRLRALIANREVFHAIDFDFGRSRAHFEA
ncbi:MAG: hypothetical protein V1821_03310 [bacterium]